MIKVSAKYKVQNAKGFTLIELLVVMAIIAVALGVSLFGLANSRLESRDSRRKADLESIRSAIEIYRADCGSYPTSLPWGNPLKGDAAPPAACSTGNIYMQTVPQDVITTRTYYYRNPGDGTYVLCAALEGVTTPDLTCGALLSNCGSATCSYSVTNP